MKTAQASCRAASFLALLALQTVACGPANPSAAPCTGDQDCSLRGGGRCLPSPLGTDACAYPDSACPDGYVWGELAGSIAGTCAGDLADASVDASDADIRDGGAPAHWALIAANARTVGGNPVEPVRVYHFEDDIWRSTWAASELDWGRSVASADYDGDGDVDFAVGNGFVDRGRNRVYRNDGTGNFSVAWTDIGVSFSPGIGWLDVDGDGALDLLAVVQTGVFWYRQTGGTFSQVGYLVPNSAGASTFKIADFDGDLVPDIVVAGTGGTSVWIHQGGETFVRVAWDGPQNARSIAVGDYNGDGAIDLAVGLSRGFFVYQVVGGIPTSAFSASEIGISDASIVEWIDIDQDGDLDLIAGHCTQNTTSCDPAPNRAYRNSGGTFSLAWTSVELDATTSIAVGDFDGDGGADVAFGNSGGPNRVYRNADGVLSLIWSSVESDNTNGLAWMRF